MTHTNETYKAPRDVAARLKRYRLSRKMTLQQVADQAGVTVGTIFRLENGIVRPTELTWSKLQMLPGIK
jgi:transcriptional regulator with XRE-family HTH domain